MSFLKSENVLSFTCLETDLIDGFPPLTINSVKMLDNYVCNVFNNNINRITKVFTFFNEKWFASTNIIDVESEPNSNILLGLSSKLGKDRAFGLSVNIGVSEKIISYLDIDFDMNVQFPNTSIPMQIASESVNDSFALGTGVKSVLITAVEETSLNEVFYIVNLNGQTPVDLPNIYRINEVQIYDADPQVNGLTFPLGNIWIGYNIFTGGIPVTKVRGISITQTNSRACIYTVPNKSIISRVRKLQTSSTSGKPVAINLYIRLVGDGVDGIFYKAPIVESNEAFEFSDSEINPFKPGSDVFATGTSALPNATAQCYLTFDYLKRLEVE